MRGDGAQRCDRVRPHGRIDRDWADPADVIGKQQKIRANDPAVLDRDLAHIIWSEQNAADDDFPDFFIGHIRMNVMSFVKRIERAMADSGQVFQGAVTASW